MIEVAHKHITEAGSLWPTPLNVDDGVGIAVPNEMLYLHDCIIDLDNLPLKNQDEAVAVTWGSSARIVNCVIRNAGKLILLGSGDEDHRADEEKKEVTLEYCLLEQFGRRGPEVQCGMICNLKNCIIRNWGWSDQFTVRSFGAWAHDGGIINATNCVFVNENTLHLRQRIQDRIYHISQAVQDNGIKALFKKLTYTAGWKRGLTASDTGKVTATHCYASDNVIVQNNTNPMKEAEAEELAKTLKHIENSIWKHLI